MEGEAQCTGTRRKEGSCIGLQEISKIGRNLSNVLTLSMLTSY